MTCWRRSTSGYATTTRYSSRPSPNAWPRSSPNISTEWGPQPLHPFGHRHAGTGADPRRPAGRHVRRADRRQSAARRTRPAGSGPRGDPRCRQGGIPAQRAFDHPDRGPCGAAFEQQRHPLCRPLHRLDALRHRTEQPPPRKTDALQHGARNAPRQAQKSGSGQSTLLANTVQTPVTDGIIYPLPDNRQTLAADVTSAYSTESIDTQIARAREEMERAAKSLDFLAAAKFRDRMYELQKLKNEK